MNNFFNLIDYKSIMGFLEMPSPPALARIRQQLMSQKAMAKAIGVDAGQLSRWEQGKGEMSYAKIRRYVHVLRTRMTAADPVALLVERIAGRVALRELRPMDPLERAIEVMGTHGHAALPVLNARGDDYLGVLTDAMVASALSVGDVERALLAPIGTLALEPMVRVTIEDDLSAIAAKLGANAIVLVEDKDRLPAGFAFRGDLWPLVTGAGR
ncbi:MAG TPA: helix-turn-helix domain-containing protein [Candidatus Thermoplasmatota archaeon]|nr:helix-turn-helix domain-containing protein [Candidatus Thermoplasmatota archaeon]